VTASDDPVYDQLVRHVPAGAVDEESGVRVGVLGDLGKQQVHREGVAGGQDERRAFAFFGGQIYGKIYFPTFSNSLKEVGRYLGFQWTWPRLPVPLRRYCGGPGNSARMKGSSAN
jgi:hypothetical protein